MPGRDRMAEGPELFHFLADALPHLVWTATSEGVVDYYNSRRVAYMGGSRDDLDWRLIVHPDEFDAMVATWRAAVAAGTVYEFEHRMRMADGSYRWHLSRAVPMRDTRDVVTKWFGTATDVHERVLAGREVASVAHALQRALLPAILPDLADWRLATEYLAAMQFADVGGDWFDAIATDETLTLVIGDVAGHGVDAAAIMGAGRHAVASLASAGESPGRVLEHANRYTNQLGIVLVTCLVVSIDTRTGAARVASAGHPPPLRLTAEKTELVALRPGPPLGATETSRYLEFTFELAPGDSCVLYTDGLIERRHEGLDEGFARLLAACETLCGSDAATLCTRLVELLKPRPDDDVAVLVAQRMPTP